MRNRVEERGIGEAVAEADAEAGRCLCVPSSRASRTLLRHTVHPPGWAQRCTPTRAPFVRNSLLKLWYPHGRQKRVYKKQSATVKTKTPSAFHPKVALSTAKQLGLEVSMAATERALPSGQHSVFNVAPSQAAAGRGRRRTRAHGPRPRPRTSGPRARPDPAARP